MCGVQVKTDNHAFESRALSKKSSYKRRDECAQIDSHVEDREPGIASFVFGFIQLPNHGADVWLEQAGAERNQNKSGVKGREAIYGHRVVAASNDDSPDQDRAPCAQQLVCQPASNQRQIPDRRNIACVYGTRIRFAETEAPIDGLRRHVEGQKRAHPVVTEALPHLGKEERRQSAGMAKETAIEGNDAGTINRCAHLSAILTLRNRERV